MQVGGNTFPSALMHLFYSQQGIFAEPEQNALSFEDPREPWPSVAQDSPTLPPLRDPQEPPPRLATPSLASEGDASDAAPTNKQSRLRALLERRDELEAKLQEGALQAENEALERKVIKAQEDILALQSQIDDMKEQSGERLDALRLALEEQQSAADQADRRVVCTEDLVRYHQEQKRLMASHWKSQCQMKDERIRYLNLQLTEYTIDWQQLGVQRQTEASLSHEHHCLQDRHRLLQCLRDSGAADLERLRARLLEAKEEEQRLREELSVAEAEALFAGESPSQKGRTAIQARHARQRARATLLREWCQQREATNTADPPLNHRCIWRDELDVREGQLEKITVQLEKTSSALHGAQVALAEQRSKHQEMKARFSEAEAQLGEGERARVQKQRRGQELRRVEAAVQRLLEAAEGQSKSSTSATSPG
eukprot:TRINITY_DN25856_c0_g1_i1.p1 TRINITY_DN25856_c0_g1~~TRINITY_DN25856_c0_g1_i1.p1  ORF type:complete len:425 (-),score=119.25 TRINITY_DN25856_c0_g1_i1:30-1304(-)